MARAMVVYESMFGNTRQIADAIAQGLAFRLDVDVVEVGHAPAIVGADVAVLVVGGPTHAFGMSRPVTRRDAAEQSSDELVSPGAGIREWLDTLECHPAGLVAATFDTRVDKPRVPGSAAKAAARRLRGRGVTLACPPQSFHVDGLSGPLIDGELDRARNWGSALASQLARAVGLT